MKGISMVAVGKPIESISLNGLEWLLNDKGDVKVFTTKNEARDFLKTHGITKSKMEDFVFWQEDV